MLLAQNGRNNSYSAFANGLGNSFAAVSGLSSIGNNPAGISDLSNFGIVLSSEQRFLLSDLTGGFLGVAKSFDDLGSFQLSLSNFGINEYQEQSIKLGYARQLTKKWDVGVSFNWWNTQIDGYGNKSLFNFNLGSIAKLSEDLKLGVFISSPYKTDLDENTELESEFRVGIEYSTSDKFLILFDVSKVLNETERIHLGIQYKFHTTFDLKLGYSSSPGIFSFGLGVRLGDALRIDASNQFQEQLGNSPSMSISYEKL